MNVLQLCFNCSFLFQMGKRSRNKRFCAAPSAATLIHPETVQADPEDESSPMTTTISPADSVLAANYASLPPSASSEALRIGHTLWHYRTCSKNAAKTARDLQALGFFPEHQSKAVSLKINKLCGQDAKLRKKFNTSHYHEFCSQVFEVAATSKPAEEIPSTPAMPAPSSGASSVFSPVKSTRSAQSCSPCKKKTRRLQYLKAKSAKLKAALKNAPKTCPERLTLLKLARRNKTVEKLKDRLKERNLMQEIDVRSKNQELRKYHQSQERVEQEKGSSNEEAQRRESRGSERLEEGGGYAIASVPCAGE
jgi:uncharacterized membrane protein YkoI